MILACRATGRGGCGQPRRELQTLGLIGVLGLVYYVANFLYLSCSCFCAAYDFSYHLNLFMSLLLFSGRENMKHHIRKVSKDLQKLFSKKSSIDVVNASETSKQCPQGYLKYNKENKTRAFD